MCRNLQGIGFYFSGEDLAASSSDDFLASLRDIGAELLRLMARSQLPKLEEIYLDIGLPPEPLRAWIPDLLDCFPLLAERGNLKIVPYIRFVDVATPAALGTSC